MAESNINSEVVRALFSYDKTTGIITNKVGRSQRDVAGAVAGSKKGNGYLSIKIFGNPYQAHRVAWLHEHGEWPSGNIDHINGIRHDNRLSNLREATAAENSQNLKLKLTNKSGFTGVFSYGDKWRAQIKFKGVKTDLGIHVTPESAYAAYLFAKSRIHTFNPVPR